MSAAARLLGGLLALALPASAGAHTIVVEPYLQQASPTSIKVLWETDEAGDSTVEWGPTDALGTTAAATSQVGNGDSRIHTAELSGLDPATRYHYRVITGVEVSDVHDFVTPAEASAEASFRIVAMSDMQRDGGNPDVFRQVVEDGVVGFVTDQFSADVPAEVAFTMIPGDLVTTGLDYASWAETFFTPSQALNRHVPLYPVLGNHEADADFYFRYFDLPANGTPGLEEHWWWLDHGNLRVIGLDSNPGYRTPTQLSWLDDVLADACADPVLDFVFVQLHHPFKSELWIAGELDYTGDVVSRLESFSTDCGKPSIHFFGHTHGYSRGQSRDHEHLWVNVATAGGNIDYWGEYAQVDYDEFTVSEDEYGFVLVEVDAGADPQFRLRRVTRGDEDTPRDNVVSDDITVRVGNTPPSPPEALRPSDADGALPPEEVLFVATLFADGDGDLQGAARYQVAEDCAFTAPLLDQWVQHENRYFGQDTQADDDLADLFVDRLPGDADLCWRVRYRDRGLAWSDWSDPAPFTTAPSALGENLLVNPGAEDGTTAWTARVGVIESLAAGECDAGNPHTGDRYFAVGGVCAGESEAGEAFQGVDVSVHRDAIDAGLVTALYRGFFADWGGDDVPGAFLVFRDGDGFEAGRAEPISSATTVWTERSADAVVPAGTTSIEFVLTGTRHAGEDNDSYIDDLALLLEVADDGDDDDVVGDDDDDSAPPDGDPPPEPPGPPDGCECAASVSGPAPGTGLLLLLIPCCASRRRCR